MQEGWCNSVNISEGATALSRLVPLRCGRERQRPAHTAHSTLSRRIDDLQVKTGRLGARVLSILDEHRCKLRSGFPKSWKSRFRNWLLGNSKSRNFCSK